MIVALARRPILFVVVVLAMAVAMTAASLGSGALLLHLGVPSLWAAGLGALVLIAGFCAVYPLSVGVAAVWDEWTDAHLTAKYGRSIVLLDDGRARIDGVVRAAVYVPQTNTLIVEGRELVWAS